jgi:NAD(P)-dependent dehydrogenase (short-subunit alcohol dehydrogenase family)
MPEKTVASELLRPALLEGVSMLLAAAPRVGQGEAFGAAVRLACDDLGARVCECDASDGPLAAGEASLDAAVDGALEPGGGLDLLVVDCASLFAAFAGAPHADADADAEAEGARAALRGCLEASWNVTRAVANRAFLAAGRGGRIVYLAPAAGAGEHAEGARAGLENLARTLSVEWARHSITVVSVAPGERTSAAEVAALVAYLASPAGAYFSGCLLDLRGVKGSAGHPAE